jgi:Xaa-Pro aminopeptidase
VDSNNCITDVLHVQGHGVGAFLNVHEGPHGIHYRIRPDEAGILADMTTSIEPGYYEDGSFGVRIENICIVVPAQTAHTFGGKRSLTFETITMAPLQCKLIDTALLTPQELAWVNAYSADVRAKLGPLMKPTDSSSSSSITDAYAYLLRETEPISA